MDTFTPIVITSRKAKKHLEHIKSRHAEIVQGIESQKQKVEAYKTQKEAERQANEQLAAQHRAIHEKEQNEILKQRMADEKEKRAHELKLKELEIKREALAKA